MGRMGAASASGMAGKKSLGTVTKKKGRSASSSGLGKIQATHEQRNPGGPGAGKYLSGGGGPAKKPRKGSLQARGKAAKTTRRARYGRGR